VLYNLEGVPETTITFDLVANAAGDMQIAHMYVMRNPDKLARVPRPS
jgi:hypothetical protein